MKFADRSRIRTDVRYALEVAKGLRPQEPKKSIYDKWLQYLSNGFVLLIMGALISSFLVPHFQRKYEYRKQQFSLMQECLSQFLLYSNTLWQEYYSVLPLTQRNEIDETEYIKYVNLVAQIKLKRYDAYAKVLATSIAFDGNGKNSQNAPIPSAIKQYAIELNAASASIDKWLTGLYCTPTERDFSPCEKFNPTFNAYDEHLKIKQLVVNFGNSGTDRIAAMIVSNINQQ